MLGAIYGDKAGSLYEYEQLKEIKPIDPKELILPNSFYSDDTIETIAIMDSIINNKDYGSTLREYILKYQDYMPNHSPYFKSMFTDNTINWATRIKKIKSKGNGAMMRISPVGYLFNDEALVIKNAYYATMTTHNTPEALYGAVTIALLIYHFRIGLSRDEIFDKLELNVEYKPFEKFNCTCSDTLGNCLYAIYNSNSFEDAIRRVLLMGGDTDTNACIVGSVAEAMYGMSDKQKNDAIEGLPDEFVNVLKRVYK